VHYATASLLQDVVSVIFVPEYRLVITASANTVWVCDDATVDSGTVLRCITNAAPANSNITTMAYRCALVCSLVYTLIVPITVLIAQCMFAQSYCSKATAHNTSTYMYF
jgi:hypothetical protein